MDNPKTAWLGLLVFLSCGNSLIAQAPKSDPCSQQQYKVLTQSALAIRCLDDVSDIVGGTGTVVLHGDSNYAQPIGNVKISFFTTGNQWLLLLLSGSGLPLRPGKKYTLALMYSVKCKADCGAGKTKTEGPVSIDIDTTESVTISPSVVDSEPRSFHATSSVGFSESGKKLSFSTRKMNQFGQYVLDTNDCTIFVLDGQHQKLSKNATCSKFVSLQNESPTEPELASVDPDEVGVYDIEFKKIFSTPLIPGPLPFKTVFGTAPKVDPKSRFSPKKAPATKDASQYYANFNWAAGVGTVPAWVLDGQVAPKLWMWDGFALGPLVAADVGNNKLSGQTYTDTINFGVTSQRPFFFRRSESWLKELLLTSGVKYETDREFNHDNLLANADLRYNFAGLYRTQSVTALNDYYDALQKYQIQKNQAGAGSGTPYVPQPDDFPSPLIGYALDFHTGIETGGALADTTVSATTGKAKQDLPAYSIFRIVPQVHGLLQLGKFTFDGNMTGRYLALTENTVVQTQANTLVLTKVRGWKGLGTVTSTYNVDPLGHFAITVVYKDGFAPPTYKRVNTVQAGILIKY